MNNLRRIAVAICALTLPLIVLTGCSGSSTKFSPPTGSNGVGAGAAGSAAAALSSALNELTGAPTSASTGALSQIKLRIVNLFAPNKTPGPAIDIYDVQLTGEKATPIATDVAYGGVSSYFSPHVEGSSSVFALVALPAGEDPVADKGDAQGLGGAQDDGSHPQLTWLLTADTGATLSGGPLGGLSFSVKVEKGTNNGDKAPLAPAPPSGQGEIMVDTQAVADATIGIYLMIDDSCTPPLNGDPLSPGLPYAFAADGQAPVSSYALFATTPGSHQVSVVGWTDSTAPTCAQLTARQALTTVQVSDGQQIEAYVYGASSTDLHLALAPITS